MLNKYDEIDFGILKEIRENCKRPVNALAEAVGISGYTFSERIKKLRKEQVIRRCQAQIDYAKLGFDMHAFVSITGGRFHVAGKVITPLIGLPEVESFYGITGTFDAVSVIRTKTRDTLAGVLGTFNRPHAGTTKTDMIFETYKPYYEFNPFYADKKYAPKPNSKIERHRHSYDALDLSIVRELRQDGHMPYREMAKRLKTHQNTLVNRIKRLEEDGVIIKYTADINYEKLGYTLSAITFVKLRRSEIPNEEFISAIVETPQVKAFYSVTGTYDCAVLFRVKNVDELSDAIDSIKDKTHDIKRSTTSVILRTYKDLSEYNPFLNMPLLKHEM